MKIKYFSTTNRNFHKYLSVKFLDSLTISYFLRPCIYAVHWKSYRKKNAERLKD